MYLCLCVFISVGVCMSTHVCLPVSWSCLGEGLYVIGCVCFFCVISVPGARKSTLCMRMCICMIYPIGHPVYVSVTVFDYNGLWIDLGQQRFNTMIRYDYVCLIGVCLRFCLCSCMFMSMFECLSVSCTHVFLVVHMFV